MPSTRKITTGTKEWADFNVNCIKGCSNNCRYCYAKMMAKRFGRCTEETWKDMEVNQKAVDKNYKKYNGRVMFPSSHDIVNDPETLEPCMIVLDKLLKEGNEVLVTTKPDIEVVKRIINQFTKYKEQIQFRFTISSNNDDTLSFWEPGAPPYLIRKEALKLAKEEGYETSLSIEPFLDYTPYELIEELDEYVTDTIWVGPMNYIAKSNITPNDEPYYTQIRENVNPEHLREIHEHLKNNPKIKFKDSLLNQMKKE